MILAHHVLVCPTLFVTTGYPLALSNQWQATPDEQRLADPQILATMHDLDRIPTDKLPPRVARLVAQKQTVPPPTVAMQNLAKLEAAGVTIVMGTDAGNIGTLHGPVSYTHLRAHETPEHLV